MTITPQQRLFGWQEIDELGDLERLRSVLEHMPDESHMRLLEAQRGAWGCADQAGGGPTGLHAGGHLVTGRREPEIANLATSEQPQRKWLTPS